MTGLRGAAGGGARLAGRPSPSPSRPHGWGAAAGRPVGRPSTGGARGAAGPLATARLALAAVLALRLSLSPFAAAVGQPDALWRPRGIGVVFASPPPVGVVLAVQAIGVAAAAVYVGKRRLGLLVVAWLCLLVLAGLRTSLGKILHNDVLLVVAAIPLLLAGRRPSDDDARTGLDAAAAVVLLAYLSCGWAKLLHSGPAWALSDNLRWSLAAGRGDAGWPALPDWLVAQPRLCVALACGILALELGAVALWLRPLLAPWFVAAAALLHAGTWLVLGLDYWAHLAAVALVLLPWARMRSR